MHESEGYRKQQIFGHTPIRPVTGKYKKADAGAGTRAVGVMCVEYDTAYDAPADKLWDCIHPYNGSFAGERTAVLLAK